MPTPAQVLVKPAGADCNLRCRYCFYLPKRDLYPGARRRMTPQVLEALVGRTMRSPAPVVAFGWQGGEPTLMGLDFFRRAVDLQARLGRPGQQVANTLQTNGLLIDREWCAFLARFRFLVGLSADGPPDVHDAYRRGRGAPGTFARARDAARLLLDHGVETNALVVLTDRSVGRIPGIWQSLKDLGLRHFQFIPCLEWAPGGKEWAPFSLLPEDHGRVLCELFDLWLGEFRDGVPGVFVRLFEALLFGYVGLEFPLCTLRETCGQDLVVEHNGDVYACDFYVEPAWKLGNVLADDLGDLLNGSRQREFGARKARLPAACGECRWLRFCHGGCPRERDHDPAGRGENPYCPSYRAFFEHADPHLRRLAQEWRRRSALGFTQRRV